MRKVEKIKVIRIINEQIANATKIYRFKKQEHLNLINEWFDEDQPMNLRNEKEINRLEADNNRLSECIKALEIIKNKIKKL